jgi:uncharacterized protein YceH (UPF0502 family)
VHLADLSEPEQRVLGCLIEKRLTTPDGYPLSLNALRLACNQVTNRDPVTDYDEATVREAAQRLSRYGFARLASGAGSRAIKYRHLADEALQLGATDLAVLSVLLLRGAQTPGELKARTERMARLNSLAELEQTLQRLIDRGYVKRIARRPGQKEDRFAQLLGGDDMSDAAGARAESNAVGESSEMRESSEMGQSSEMDERSGPHSSRRLDPDNSPAAPWAGTGTTPTLADRVDALEAEVAALRAAMSDLERGSHRLNMKPSTDH